MESDAQLVEAWSKGDTTAARALIDRYFDGLCRFFRSKVPDEAEDLIQQTLLICVRRRDAVRDWASFRAYLYSVARNELHGHFRRKKRGGNVDLLETSVADLSPSPSGALAFGQDRRVLLEALRQIPVDLQIALELRYWEQLTGPELAEVLAIPEGTVRSRLRRATAALKAKFGELSESGEAAVDVTAGLEAWAADLRDKARARS